jgi:hypothetical protein
MDYNRWVSLAATDSAFQAILARTSGQGVKAKTFSSVTSIHGFLVSNRNVKPMRFGINRIETRIQWPAVFLIAIGGLGLMVSSWCFLFSCVGLLNGLIWSSNQSLANQEDWTFFLNVPVFFAVGLQHGLMMFAGQCILERRHYRATIAGCILAVFPSFCLCLSTPVGIWALIWLNDDQVKSEFDRSDQEDPPKDVFRVLTTP